MLGRFLVCLQIQPSVKQKHLSAICALSRTILLTAHLQEEASTSGFQGWHQTAVLPPSRQLPVKYSSVCPSTTLNCLFLIYFFCVYFASLFLSRFQITLLFALLSLEFHFIYIYVCVFICVYIYIYIHIYIYIYVCVCVDIDIYIYIFILASSTQIPGFLSLLVQTIESLYPWHWTTAGWVLVCRLSGTIRLFLMQ